MALDKRKIIRNITMGLYFFLSGVEYAVIIPTLNGFLLSMDAETVFLGIVMASFSFTGLMAAPVYGRIADRTRSTKMCVIVGNTFEIVGNFLYFISSNKYMVWGSRLIAGLGTGASSSIFGMISRTTTTEERTSVFSQLMALRQIGLLIGPGFNVFLSKLNFKIGPFIVDQFTSPGLLMVILWLLHTLFIAIAYKDIPKSRSSNVNDQTTSDVNGVVNHHDYDEIGDKEIANTIRERAASIVTRRPVKSFLKEFLREQVIVCLAITFMLMFSQTGLEAAVTPLTLLFFEWNGLKNSILFCGAGFLVIVSFLSLSFLSKRISDRILLLSGCIGMVCTYIMFLVYTVVLYIEDYDDVTPSWLLPIFCINVAMLTISLPFIWVPQASLFSKITSEETQAFNQGIRLVAMGLGQIIGPIWAASMATLKRLPIMLSVDVFLMCMITLMVCMSFKYLVAPPSTSTPVSSENEENTEDTENTPLLSNGNSSRAINA